MPDTILPYEPYVRLGVSVGVFVLLAAWELIGPRRRQPAGRAARWPGNLGIVVLDTILVRLVFPVTGVGLALLAEARGWGLFNLAALPNWIAVAASVVLLDLAIYLQHVLFHAVPALWRLHRMHHADLAFDVTTGLRFHPVEILLSMLIKLTVIAALGAPALSVLIFEVLLNATSMFSHGNIRIPKGFDRVLRWLVVTPDMHRVHHSTDVAESNSNFAMLLPWWDHLFSTYQHQPLLGHEGMKLGIAEARTADDVTLLKLLMLPFSSPASEAATSAMATGRRARS